MIHITYHRNHYRITAKGHAQSGEVGHDLVCASVSALVLTAAANVATLATNGTARSPVLKIQEGDAEIACSPVHKMKSVVMLIFDTVCTGFELLQTYYPENISYEVLG